MKWLLMTIFLTTSGCLGNISGSDFATLGGSVTGAAVTAALTTEPTLLVAGTAVGAIAGAVSVGEQETIKDELEALPEEQRAAALKNHNMWKVIEELGLWAIAAVLAFFLLPLIIGYFLPNGRQRKMEHMMFDDPNYRKRDMK